MTLPLLPMLPPALFRRAAIALVCATAFALATDAWACDLEKTRAACSDGMALSEVLPGYQRSVSAQPLHYAMTQFKRLPGLAHRGYRLTSQSWSPDDVVAPAAWHHAVDIYIPDQALPRRALLVVNNGRFAGAPSPACCTLPDTAAPTDFDTDTLVDIAKRTRTIVVSVSDVPNQHLEFGGDGRPRDEDDSVARSWALFFDAPERRATLPLQVPMTAAVSRAMSLAQQELRSRDIDRFIVSGISKRGWAAWLSAITDARVDAIAPFAYELLDMRAGLRHIHDALGNAWPVAFQPYCAERVDQRIGEPAFTRLMRVVDPLQYLGTRHAARLDLPKYLIGASGDDFYAPDSAGLYYDRLPGGKALRMLPNAGHADVRGSVSSALVPFVNRIQQGGTLPVIDAALRQQGASQHLTVHFSERPVQVRLWTANNPAARDFRYAQGVRYAMSPLTPSARQTIDIAVHTPSQGWRAHFVEAVFEDGLVATTPVFVLPRALSPAA